MPRKLGTVLIVDDSDSQATKRRLDKVVQSIVLHPNDVTPDDLKRAKLVLVDYVLDKWPERNAQNTPSLKPMNGVALIAVLKSNIHSLNAAPTAFALNSGELSLLSGGGKTEGREHAIAKSVDLEWVFAKTGDAKDFATSVKSLAEAVDKLPPLSKWPSSVAVKNKITSLLAIPANSRWRLTALESIDQALPPHEISIRNSAGVALLRWLLHAVLPYPTFLLDERYLALRLTVEPSSFSKALRSDQGSRIVKALSGFGYRGVLADFNGRRWWRAGLEQWLWESTKGRSFDRNALQQLVKSKLSGEVKFTELPSPVVSLDDSLRPSDILIDVSTAVVIRPDGWPTFADAAWISTDSMTDKSFVALIPQSEATKHDLGK